MLDHEVGKLRENWDCAVIYNELSKENVFARYNDHISNFKERFMKNQKNPDANVICDRHKVVGALMISIMEASPVVVAPELRFADGNTKFLFNEFIAIRVGLALLFQFTLNEVKKTLDAETCAEREFYEAYRGRLENADILYPNANHPKVVGDYIDGWKKELYFNNKYGTLSVLSLANELFLFERFNEISRRAEFLQAKLGEGEPKLAAG
jgi:hypothetical protein